MLGLQNNVICFRIFKRKFVSIAAKALSSTWEGKDCILAVPSGSCRRALTLCLFKLEICKKWKSDLVVIKTKPCSYGRWSITGNPCSSHGHYHWRPHFDSPSDLNDSVVLSWSDKKLLFPNIISETSGVSKSGSMLYSTFHFVSQTGHFLSVLSAVVDGLYHFFDKHNVMA